MKKRQSKEGKSSAKGTKLYSDVKSLCADLAKKAEKDPILLSYYNELLVLFDDPIKKVFNRWKPITIVEEKVGEKWRLFGEPEPIFEEKRVRLKTSVEENRPPLPLNFFKAYRSSYLRTFLKNTDFDKLYKRLAQEYIDYVTQKLYRENAERRDHINRNSDLLNEVLRSARKGTVSGEFANEFNAGKRKQEQEIDTWRRSLEAQNSLYSWDFDCKAEITKTIDASSGFVSLSAEFTSDLSLLFTVTYSRSSYGEEVKVSTRDIDDAKIDLSRAIKYVTAG